MTRLQAISALFLAIGAATDKLLPPPRIQFSFKPGIPTGPLLGIRHTGDNLFVSYGNREVCLDINEIFDALESRGGDDLMGTIER